MRFLRPLERLLGMFHGLPGLFVPRLVIFFPVMHGGGAVRVRSEFVELRSSLVRVIWHGASRPWECPILELFDFVNCSILYTRATDRISVEGCLAIRPTRS